MGGKKKRDGKIDFTAEHTDRPLAVSQTRAKKINHPYRYFFFFLLLPTRQHERTHAESLASRRLLFPPWRLQNMFIYRVALPVCFGKFVLEEM